MPVFTHKDTVLSTPGSHNPIDKTQRAKRKGEGGAKTQATLEHNSGMGVCSSDGVLKHVDRSALYGQESTPPFTNTQKNELASNFFWNAGHTYDTSNNARSASLEPWAATSPLHLHHASPPEPPTRFRRLHLLYPMRRPNTGSTTTQAAKCITAAVPTPKQTKVTKATAAPIL